MQCTLYSLQNDSLSLLIYISLHFLSVSALSLSLSLSICHSFFLYAYLSALSLSLYAYLSAFSVYLYASLSALSLSLSVTYLSALSLSLYAYLSTLSISLFMPIYLPSLYLSVCLSLWNKYLCLVIEFPMIGQGDKLNLSIFSVCCRTGVGVWLNIVHFVLLPNSTFVLVEKVTKNEFSYFPEN